jgi:hypothetical protein
MYTLAKIIHCLFPLIALMLLLIGIKKNAIYYVISSLWISIIALAIHYQMSGGEILGSYFNYINAFIYSLNLIILFLALIRIISHLSLDNPIFKYTCSFIQAFIVIASLLVMANLWINAHFIETRMQGTPVMQVALIHKPNYCSYRYIFYKVAADGAVSYLCPNHYGFIPSTGHLSLSPDFITTQLSISSKRQMLILQKKS